VLYFNQTEKENIKCAKNITDGQIMSQTELITMAVNEFYKKSMEEKMDEKMIGYDDFANWHTANGTDTVNDATLRAAYEVYKILFAEGGKESADDKICGHPVWNK
jgi:hypothetical protein